MTKPSTLQYLAQALKTLPCRDMSGRGDDLDNLRRREAVRAMLKYLRAPTLEIRQHIEGKSGQAFVDGWQKMIDDIMSGEGNADAPRT